MNTSRARLALGGVALVGGGVAIWSGYRVLASRSVEHVEYTVERTIDDRTEIRRYPELVRVETTGSSNREAFGRLFSYIQSENESRSDVEMTAPIRTDEESDGNGESGDGESGDGESVEMTAPVRTESATEGESVSMTTPVRTDGENGEVRMGFYLPEKYIPNTAPTPTDPAVSLVTEPPRSVATRRFSWWAFDWRTRRQQSKLIDSLAETDVTPVGEPFSLGYDALGTPPFLRTNEVAVEVEW